MSGALPFSAPGTPSPNVPPPGGFNGRQSGSFSGAQSGSFNGTKSGSFDGFSSGSFNGPSLPITGSGSRSHKTGDFVSVGPVGPSGKDSAVAKSKSSSETPAKNSANSTSASADAKAKAAQPGRKNVPGMVFLGLGVVTLGAVLAFIAFDHLSTPNVELPEDPASYVVTEQVEQPVGSFDETVTPYNDPVSNERVNPTQTPYKVDLYGTYFYFTTKEHLEAFVADPFKYVKPNVKVRVKLNPLPDQQSENIDVDLGDLAKPEEATTKPAEEASAHKTTAETKEAETSASAGGGGTSQYLQIPAPASGSGSSSAPSSGYDYSAPSAPSSAGSHGVPGTSGDYGAHSGSHEGSQGGASLPTSNEVYAPQTGVSLPQEAGGAAPYNHPSSGAVFEGSATVPPSQGNYPSGTMEMPGAYPQQVDPNAGGSYSQPGAFDAPGSYPQQFDPNAGGAYPQSEGIPQQYPQQNYPQGGYPDASGSMGNPGAGWGGGG